LPEVKTRSVRRPMPRAMLDLEQVVLAADTAAVLIVVIVMYCFASAFLFELIAIFLYVNLLCLERIVIPLIRRSTQVLIDLD